MGNVPVETGVAWGNVPVEMGITWGDVPMETGIAWGNVPIFFSFSPERRLKLVPHKVDKTLIENQRSFQPEEPESRERSE